MCKVELKVAVACQHRGARKCKGQNTPVRALHILGNERRWESRRAGRKVLRERHQALGNLLQAGLQLSGRALVQQAHGCGPKRGLKILKNPFTFRVCFHTLTRLENKASSLRNQPTNHVCVCFSGYQLTVVTCKCKPSAVM